ncbi:Meiotic nuclear division protein 1 [Apophysomyces sp. BC1034]|nr:Meiotic nuclear division protein 1 [Apophysomyces sp. BC1015]KAG0176909.1 Meiotic nuclear division protein 1 [Apophysomyces sp. BC1021]KAG0189437.1 Meiotic nuclear division protein 1 [Apophysomyces sp. BC1034]
MSRKGVSAEEKRKRLEKHFHETSDFFQLKELEKIGPKKGIVAQSVKEVLTGLVDDGLVTTDKIGNSTYFWSFPSAAVQNKRNKLEDLKKQVEQEEEKKMMLEDAITAAKIGREPSDERESVLKELQQAQETQRALAIALQEYKDNDPAMFAVKEKAAVVAKEAANRWTENVWTIQSYCVNKFGMERQMFNQSFGIDDEFDTLP